MLSNRYTDCIVDFEEKWMLTVVTGKGMELTPLEGLLLIENV